MKSNRMPRWEGKPYLEGCSQILGVQYFETAKPSVPYNPSR